MNKADDNARELERLGKDFQSLGYFVLTRNDFLPGVLAFKVVNGNLIAFAAEYESSGVDRDRLSNIFRNFDGVLIATPNEEVKARILKEVHNTVSERLRSKICVVVMGRFEEERRLKEGV